MGDTATAHHEWDRTWQSEAGRADWLVPHEQVRAIVPELRARHMKRAVDLGCGVGRHALFLADQGLDVLALDASESGTAFCRQQADARGLSLEVRLGEMTHLPVADGSVDYVLAFNVIYHGGPDVVARTMEEVRRVLRPSGLFQATLLSKRNSGYGAGTKIAPNTFVVPGAADDKVHPHFYCNAAEAAALLEGFELLWLFDRDERVDGHWHWHFLAEKLA